MNLDPTKTRIPVRVQRKRERGWRKPYDTVNVTRPSIYGNPFKVGSPYPGTDILINNTSVAVQAYEDWLNNDPKGKVVLSMAKKELRGHNLMCWCPIGDHCHADVLLKLANS